MSTPGLGPSLYHGDVGYIATTCESCGWPAVCDGTYPNLKGEQLSVCGDCKIQYELDHAEDLDAN